MKRACFLPGLINGDIGKCIFAHINQLELRVARAVCRDWRDLIELRPLSAESLFATILAGDDAWIALQWMGFPNGLRRKLSEFQNWASMHGRIKTLRHLLNVPNSFGHYTDMGQFISQAIRHGNFDTVDALHPTLMNRSIGRYIFFWYIVRYCSNVRILEAAITQWHVVEPSTFAMTACDMTGGVDQSCLVPNVAWMLQSGLFPQTFWVSWAQQLVRAHNIHPMLDVILQQLGSVPDAICKLLRNRTYRAVRMNPNIHEEYCKCGVGSKHKKRKAGTD